MTAADDDEFYTMLEEILLSQHECVIMGDFNLPNIDWTVLRPTPAPDNKLMQLLAECRYPTNHIYSINKNEHGFFHISMESRIIIPVSYQMDVVK